MGIGIILEVKKVVFLVIGVSKVDVVYVMVEGLLMVKCLVLVL